MLFKGEFSNSNIFINKNNMDIKTALNNYLGKSTRYSEMDNGDGSKQVCDLDTGDCYTVRMKDGLIERVENTMTINKKVKVETRQGFKQLLNG
jgi:hypothetical protein